jgi:hypothetical protein
LFVGHTNVLKAVQFIALVTIFFLKYWAVFVGHETSKPEVPTDVTAGEGADKAPSLCSRVLPSIDLIWQPFTGSGDVSILVKYSREECKTIYNQ